MTKKLLLGKRWMYWFRTWQLFVVHNLTTGGWFLTEKLSCRRERKNDQVGNFWASGKWRLKPIQMKSGGFGVDLLCSLVTIVLVSGVAWPGISANKPRCWQYKPTWNRWYRPACGLAGIDTLRENFSWDWRAYTKTVGLGLNMNLNGSCTIRAAGNPDENLKEVKQKKKITVDRTVETISVCAPDYDVDNGTR